MKFEKILSLLSTGIFLTSLVSCTPSNPSTSTSSSSSSSVHEDYYEFDSSIEDANVKTLLKEFGQGYYSAKTSYSSNKQIEVKDIYQVATKEEKNKPVKFIYHLTNNDGTLDLYVSYDNTTNDLSQRVFVTGDENSIDYNELIEIAKSQQNVENKKDTEIVITYHTYDLNVRFEVVNKESSFKQNNNIQEASYYVNDKGFQINEGTLLFTDLEVYPVNENFFETTAIVEPSEENENQGTASISIKEDATIPSFLVIPNKIGNYSITKVADNFLKDNSTLEYLYLYQCTSIGENAFENCNTLKQVKFYDFENVTKFSVGKAAFKNCHSLEHFIGSKVVTIEEQGTFSQEVGDEAFMNCSSLKSFTIENDIMPISSIGAVMAKGFVAGKKAFYNCYNLETFEVKGSVYKLSAEAFYGTTNLVNYNVDYYCLMAEIQMFAFAFSGITSFEIVSQAPIMPTLDYPLNLSQSAFYGSTNLNEFVIDQTQTKHYSFEGNCLTLKTKNNFGEKPSANTLMYVASDAIKVEIPNYVENISTFSFSNVDSVEEVISNSTKAKVTTLNNVVFYKPDANETPLYFINSDSETIIPESLKAIHQYNNSTLNYRNVYPLFLTLDSSKISVDENNKAYTVTDSSLFGISTPNSLISLDKNSEEYTLDSQNVKAVYSGAFMNSNLKVLNILSSNDKTIEFYPMSFCLINPELEIRMTQQTYDLYVSAMNSETNDLYRVIDRIQIVETI